MMEEGGRGRGEIAERGEGGAASMEGESAHFCWTME